MSTRRRMTETPHRELCRADRLEKQQPSRSGLRHRPRTRCTKSAKTASTRRTASFWPRPTLLRLAAGDAATIVHATPHSATRVETSEPRLMGYFRITPKARPSRSRTVYLEALYGIGSEWPGRADVVATLVGGGGEASFQVHSGRSGGEIGPVAAWPCNAPRIPKCNRLIGQFGQFRCLKESAEEVTMSAA